MLATVDITLHYSFAEVKAKTPGDTLRDVYAKVLAETLARRLEELNAGKVGETVTDLKAASPVLTLAATVAEMKAQTAGKKHLAMLFPRQWSTRKLSQ